ncbi:MULTISPECIES: TM2 domain-containing protein [unclassified Nocardioides]|uniref:TM2 domain-containing protein n=1 Tax=unclassified Nocardioides TaxID=2615069 RepID=UPI000A2679C6|nr:MULTISPECIES: TM2 domain-containing protein [unclassified Nocardioides]
MTTGPETPDPTQPPEGQQPPSPSGDQAPPPPYGEPTPPPYGQPTPPPYGGQVPPPAGGQQPPPYAQPSGYPPPPAGGYPGQQPYNPAAPYGVHPVTGIPYSDKTKLVAGLLQILIPLGIGRFYIGDTKTGVWQVIVTVLTCGIGALWPFIDGIIILATDSVDAQGRPLRSS